MLLLTNTAPTRNIKKSLEVLPKYSLTFLHINNLNDNKRPPFQQQFSKRHIQTSSRTPQSKQTYLEPQRLEKAAAAAAKGKRSQNVRRRLRKIRPTDRQRLLEIAKETDNRAKASEAETGKINQEDERWRDKLPGKHAFWKVLHDSQAMNRPRPPTCSLMTYISIVSCSYLDKPLRTQTANQTNPAGNKGIRETHTTLPLLVAAALSYDARRWRVHKQYFTSIPQNQDRLSYRVFFRGKQNHWLRFKMGTPTSRLVRWGYLSPASNSPAIVLLSGSLSGKNGRYSARSISARLSVVL